MTGSATTPRFLGPWAFAILVAALVARLAFVASVPPVIQWPDALEYEGVAISLLDHGGYGPKTLRPPGYPTVIAAVYALTGRSLTALRVVEALLGTVVVAWLGWAATRMWGARPGLLTATLAALHPVMAFLPSTQYSETVLLLVLVPAFALACQAWRRSGVGAWAASGALFGLAALVRPNIVLLLPGLALGALFAMRRERLPWARAALVFAITFAAVLAPWTLRNHAVHGHWFFVATGGGRAIWAGNNPGASARSNTLTTPDSAMLAELAALPGEIERDRYLARAGLRFMLDHPARAATLYATKLGNLFALYPEPLTRSRYISVWSRVSQGLASTVIFAGALLALVHWRREPALWMMTGAIVTFALAHAVFFSILRYRMAFEPCLLWMAGFGWARLLEARFRWGTRLEAL